jgi:hypothetical protein
MPDWTEVDNDGLPVHLRVGLTKDNQGPADPPDPQFHHWGCWCGDNSCPGPPVCTATSWPFTVNDSQCVMAATHNGKHRDVDGFEWGGDD